MKYRKTDKWDNIKSTENLLFFAQMFDELFFDFSLDTYKPSAMNTSLLCEEALEVIEEINKGNIKQPNLQHVIDELCENLSKDHVVKSLLSLELKQINSVLLDPKQKSDDKKIVIELILRQIYLKKYKKKNEELLIQTINGENNFSIIRSLARSYATTLLNIGYSSEFISETTKKFFHYDKNRISGNEAIKDFIDIFSHKVKSYRLIYRAKSDIELYSDSLSTFNVKIIETIDDLDVDLTNHSFTKGADEVFICVDDIKSRDTHSAKNKAEKILDTLSTIFGLFHHKEQLNWASDCLIIDDTDKVVNRSRVSINAMHKCIDQKKSRAAQQANRFLSEFGLEKNSFNIFARSAELHSLALKSESNENQMLNLWISLESIIPACNDDKISNIEHIVNSIIPFLNLSYYQTLVARLTSDLFNWNRGQTKRILKQVSGENQVVKLAKLLSIDEHQGLRNEFKNSFNDFHLLKDRFEYLEHVYSSPKNMLNGLESHTKRIGWQIRRIYRARNMIVHSGTTPSYIEMLIENIHSYLDHVIREIIDLVSDSQKILSIEQAFTLTKMTYKSLGDTLSKKDQRFTNELIEQMYKV
ncbi:hypothetical protein ACK3Z6_17120 [Aeromonas caviae]|nr:hypothetical protein [Aeromonas caviae]MDH1842576.1 hypothetical protein [Aeromonas caviae]